MKRGRLSFWVIALTAGMGLIQSVGSATAALAETPSAVELKLPAPELETLPNGLTVAWFLSDRLPVLDLALLVQSGSRDDPAKKAGTSELLAWVMDRGSAGLSAEKFAREVERLGASRFCSSSEDTFTLGMHGLAGDGPRLLELLAQYALRPNLEAAEVDRERDRMVTSWRNLGDQPGSLAELVFYRAITNGTDYSRGSMVTLKELRSIATSDLRAFHSRHFTPRNSVLMVVGRADRAAFRALLTKHFGEWRGDAPERTRVPFGFPHLKPARDEVLLVDRPGVNQAQVKMGLQVSDVRSPRRYALSVVNALLGEFFDSRLNSLIRDRLGLTYGIGSQITYTRDQGRFQIASATRAEEAGRLIVETKKVLAELSKTAIPDEEARIAKDYLMGGFPLQASTLSAVATRWLGGYVYGLGPQYLNEFLPKVGLITAADASSAARAELSPDRMVTVVAGDAKQVIPVLRKHGLKVRQVTLESLLGESMAQRPSK